jgi:hypothetical protein
MRVPAEFALSISVPTCTPTERMPKFYGSPADEMLSALPNTDKEGAESRHTPDYYPVF